MVRSVPSCCSFSKAIWNTDRYYDEVCDYEPEATSSVTPIPTVTLANGVEMPMLGLGTTHSGGYHHDVVIHALRNCGYRMIDTAKRYGVERELGFAWKQSGVSRSCLFLCSKLWPTDFGSGTRNAFELSCRKLQTDYIDLYMTHFPVVPDSLGNSRSVLEDTWRQLELLYDEGRIRAIGVSNYSEDDLTELLEYCSVKPHVNQCEFHPWYNPAALRCFCADNNILYTVFDFSLDANDLTEMAELHSNPKKLVRFEDLPAKFDLPDGYKLAGRVFGVPCEGFPSPIEAPLLGSVFVAEPNFC